jgi:hypothetical protein
MFSSADPWVTGTQTRQIDTSGNLSDSTGDGLFTVDSLLVPDDIVDGEDTGETMSLGYTDAQGDQITTGDDFILGNVGDDTIDGDAGNDTIDGGADNDSIDGGTGDDSLLGGVGSDTLVGGDGADTLDGGTEDDSIDGGTGNDSLLGGDGLDTLSGGVGADTLDGGAENDSIDGGTGNDSLLGGVGSDTLAGGLGADTLDGGAGDDDLTAASGDTASGGGGDDAFILDPTNTDGPGTITLDGGDDATSGSPAGTENGNAGDSLDFTGLTNVQLVTGPVDDGTGSLSGTVSYENIDGETITVNFSEIENLSGVPCFVRGTRIATARGEVPIEDLRVDDRVITRDNGLQRVRWIGSRKVAGFGKLAPVRILSGALGTSDRDLWLSPNHRILRTGWDLDLLFETNEVLVAGKHLLQHDGIQQCQVASVEYFHVLFDQHQVILSNGLWTESFHPGQEGMAAFDEDVRAEILAIFPELSEEHGLNNYGSPARSVLKAYEAELLKVT